jgi:hypothetical protein
MWNWLFPSDEQWELLSDKQRQVRFFCAAALAMGIGVGVGLPACYHLNNAVARLACSPSFAWSSAVRAEVESNCSSGIR